MTETWFLTDDQPPEAETERLAQILYLTEPMEAFLQTTEDWMAASTTAFGAVKKSRYTGCADHFLLRYRIESIKFHAVYLMRLLDDHLEGRLKPGVMYRLAAMPLNTALQLKADLGQMFDFCTDADGLRDRNGTDLVHVSYGLPGSLPVDEDGGENDAGDNERDIDHHVTDQHIAPPKQPTPEILPKTDAPGTTRELPDGFFDFNDDGTAPVEARPLEGGREDRFRSTKRNNE